MKRIFRSSRLWISFALLVLSVVCIGAQTAYGWLASVMISPGTASFDTVDLSDPLLVMWKYNTEKEVEPLDGVPAGWQTLFSGSPTSGRFASAHADTGIEYDDEIEEPEKSISLHFGTVDNLTELNQDNYVFVRIKAEKQQGLTVSSALNVSVTMTGITVYDKDGVDLTDPSQSAEEQAIPAKLLKNNLIAPYLSFSWFASATEYTAAQLFDDHLEDFEPFDAPTVNGTTGVTTYDLTTDAQTASANAWYFYLCISPDLSFGDNAFAQAAEDLTTSMPATMYFDMSFLFEIRQAAEEW